MFQAKTGSVCNMDRWGANTDIPVRVEGEDMRLYAMVVPVILGYLASQQQGVGNIEGAGLYSQAACVCFTIALVALTASCPLPCSSRAQQICLFHLILGCALILSLAVPNMLCWAPYLCCIRPIFHLLPHSFQLRVLQFFQYVFDAIKRLVGLVSFVVGSFFQMLRKTFGLLIEQGNAIGRLVSVGVSRNTPQPSSPVQANFNSQQEVVELRVQEVTSTDASFCGVHKP